MRKTVINTICLFVCGVVLCLAIYSLYAHAPLEDWMVLGIGGLIIGIGFAIAVIVKWNRGQVAIHWVSEGD